MKFMKLGSKPDTFYTSESLRSVSSEVPSDFIVVVNGNRYLLHKFPLLSKCSRLQKLCSESLQQEMVEIPDFPCSVEAFEVCAKFCYGITITLSGYNLVAAWRAAEYLQMTEGAEKGNLICKIEVFFNSCVLHGWKDSIVSLQSSKAFHIWSEEVGITTRCIEGIATRVMSRPFKASGGNDSVVVERQGKSWWGEDVAELPIDLYWRTMIAIKSSGKVPSRLIGDSLQVYASRWFPTKQSVSDLDSRTAKESNSKHRLLLESIVSLLPSEKGAVQCSFLLKLLKAANKLAASSSSKTELVRRVGIQLEDASVKDLLIAPPASRANETTKYDVDIVMSILEQFMSQGQSPPTSPPRLKGRFERRRRSKSMENIDMEFQDSRRLSSASHSAKLKVARIVDRYLLEIARDVNLPLSKMISIAESIPDFARTDHDVLYKAIDAFLKAHPELNKSERKRLCRVLDCKKLSMEACTHAAQNELLPLRVVVQVLFYEHARAAIPGNKVTDLPDNIKALLATQDDDNTSSRQHSAKPPSTTASIRVASQQSASGPVPTLKMKLAENESIEASKLKSVPTQPKRVFSKLISMNRSASEKH